MTFISSYSYIVVRMRSQTERSFYFHWKNVPEMYLKMNQSVKKPWHRPSMGVALFRVMCSWHRSAVPTVSAHVTWCSWLFFAVFDCIFQNSLCCWWGRTHGRTEKTTVCIWHLFQTKWQISWRWANFATQAEGRKSKNVFFSRLST